MGIYTFINMAGSTGKTTTCTTLAILNAFQGRTIRLIDFDAQANASWWCDAVVTDSNQPTIADVILGDATLQEASVEVKGVPGLQIVPGKRGGLHRVQVHLSRGTGAEFGLHDILYQQGDDVDHTIIDPPGTFNTLSQAALIACTANDDDPDAIGKSGAIAVTKPGAKEAQGIPELLEEIESVNHTYRRNLKMLAVVSAEVPRSQNAGNNYSEEYDEVVATYGELASPPVRRLSIVPVAYKQKIPLPLFGAKTKLLNEDYSQVLVHLQGQGCLV